MYYFEKNCEEGKRDVDFLKGYVRMKLSIKNHGMNGRRGY